MADSGTAVKQFAGEMGQAASEVAKDVKDEVGQMIEQGTQSVMGKQLTPQQIQQRELEEQKKLQETRRKIKWYQDIVAAQKAVREKEKQLKLQKQQAIQQERQVKQIQVIQKKQKLPPEMTATGKAEIKGRLPG